MTKKELDAVEFKFGEAHVNLNEWIMLNSFDSYLGHNASATSCIETIRNVDDNLKTMHECFLKVCEDLEKTLDKLEEVNKEINFDLKRLSKYTEPEEDDEDED